METISEKYQIFISSPFGLSDQRKAAIEAVLKHKHIPIALDTFSSRSKSDLEVIGEAIDNCQLMILIVGEDIGTIYEGTKSFTQMEFEIAKAKGLSILPFFMGAKEAEQLLKDALASDEITDKVFNEKLKSRRKFEKLVKGRFFGPPWSSDWDYNKFVSEFQSSLTTQLYEKKEEINLPGWIRGLADNRAREVQLAIKNEFIQDTVISLNSFKRLDQRCGEYNQEKMALAEYFCEELGQYINNGNPTLFFESGSTPAYVAKELAARKLEVTGRDDLNINPPEIYTNNVLVFLHYWLTDRIPIKLLPSSTPEEPYGACFGQMAVVSNTGAYYDKRELKPGEKETISRLKHELIEKIGQDGLIICATSGIQISEKYHFEYPKNDSTDPVVEEEIRDLKGFHVGDYKNMLFKKALVSTEIPMVIVATFKKIDMKIRVGKCRFVFDDFVFDDDVNWNTFINKRRVAFCIGCTNSEIDDLKLILKNMGLIVETGARQHYMAVLGKTKSFDKMLQIE